MPHYVSTLCIPCHDVIAIPEVRDFTRLVHVIVGRLMHAHQAPASDPHTRRWVLQSGKAIYTHAIRYLTVDVYFIHSYDRWPLR